MEHREILLQYCTLLGDHTFLWQRKSAEDHGERRVGLAIRNILLKMVKPGDKGYECLMTLHLHTSDGPITLVSIHAPTLTSTAEAKDKFYANLSEVVKNTSSKEHLIILGDYNARVGAIHNSWPSWLGHFGVGKINKSEQSLLEFCYYHGPCVTNAYFQTKPQHKVSWHQLGMILIWRVNLKIVLLICTYHSADCDTDHSLVCCKIRLQPKKLHSSKQKGKPCIDTTSMQFPEKVK